MPTRSVKGENSMAAAGKGDAFLTQPEHEREREAAARGIAPDDQGSFRADCGAHGVPDGHGVVESSGEGIFGRETVIGGVDTQSAEGETGGIGPVSDRGAGEVSAAMQVEKDATGGGLRIRLDPFAGNASRGSRR